MGMRRGHVDDEVNSPEFHREVPVDRYERQTRLLVQPPEPRYNGVTHAGTRKSNTALGAAYSLRTLKSVSEIQCCSIVK